MQQWKKSFEIVALKLFMWSLIPSKAFSKVALDRQEVG